MNDFIDLITQLFDPIYYKWLLPSTYSIPEFLNNGYHVLDVRFIIRQSGLPVFFEE